MTSAGRQMIYTIQDKDEGRLDYIATTTTTKAAQELIADLEEQDLAAGEYRPDRYIVKERRICWGAASRTCGNVKNSVCMLDNIERDCPARKGK